MKPLSRRKALLTGLLSLPPPLRGRAGGEPWVALLANSTAAHAIGAAYLRAYPNDTLASVPATARLPRTLVATRVSEDFASGRVVMLEGWMLSVTEARLCALALRDA